MYCYSFGACICAAVCVCMRAAAWRDARLGRMLRHTQTEKEGVYCTRTCWGQYDVLTGRRMGHHTLYTTTRCALHTTRTAHCSRRITTRIGCHACACACCSAYASGGVSGDTCDNGADNATASAHLVSWRRRPRSAHAATTRACRYAITAGACGCCGGRRDVRGGASS